MASLAVFAPARAVFGVPEHQTPAAVKPACKPGSRLVAAHAVATRDAAVRPPEGNEAWSAVSVTPWGKQTGDRGPSYPSPWSYKKPSPQTLSPQAPKQKPSEQWQWHPAHPTNSELWNVLRAEAEMDAKAEPSLASYLHTTILAHNSLAKTMSFLLANKLQSGTLLATQLMRTFADAYEQDPDILEACLADLQAVKERDPACARYTQCILYFKGFQAIQCHRIAHWLWTRGRKTLAIALQSRVSEALGVDIHPAAKIGRGVLMDHATGIVIGETAEVGDNVSMLHQVTLGGSGTSRGNRHPKIGHGVLLGAGVCVLGPVTIGDGSKVGAGSVVVTSLPCHCVAVGVPARIIKQDCKHEPAQDMDQCSDFIFDYQI